jgi:hypothetical protein
MPARSTEDWKAATLRKSPDGWDASREWIVIGASSQEEAFNAHPEPGTDPIACIDESHNANGALRCKNLNCRAGGGPNVFRIQAQYGIPPAGVDNWTTIAAAAAQLRLPTRFRISPGTITLPVDRDIYGNPIANAAGDAFAQPLQRTIPLKYLIATRTEPYWDYRRLRKFEEAWNAKEMFIGGTRFAAGEVLCESIYPTSEFSVKTNNPSQDAAVGGMEIQYTFLLLKVFYVKGSGERQWAPFPHAAYMLNQGRRGWYRDKTSGEARLGELYYNNGGRQVSDDVPLGLDGRPIDFTFRVSPDGLNFYPPIQNPKLQREQKSAPWSNPSVATYLQFDLNHWADFDELKL